MYMDETMYICKDQLAVQMHTHVAASEMSNSVMNFAHASGACIAVLTLNHFHVY